MRKSILIVGSGKLSSAVCLELCRLVPDCDFYITSRSLDKCKNRVNLIRYICSQWELYPNIWPIEMDLLRVGESALTLESINPNIIFNATTPFPWWMISSLPSIEADLAMRSGPGIWAALDCILPSKLLEAILQSGSKPLYINGCYPDMTNTFLSGDDLSPSLGIGNISNLVPGLQLGFAFKLGVEPKSVRVKIVGHHYVSWNAPSPQGCRDGDYYLSIRVSDQEFLFRGPDDTPFEVLRSHASRVRGLEGLGVTVASASSLLHALLSDTKRLVHSPGARGLPGGYPVEIEADGTFDLALPPGVDVDLAVEINRNAQRLDGIESVVAQRVVIGERAQHAFDMIFGYNCPEVTRENLEEVSYNMAYILREKYNLPILL